MKNLNGVMAALVALMGLSACATSNAGNGGLQGPVYSQAEQRRPNVVIYGTVLRAVLVVLQGEKSSTDTIVGAGVGGVIGGALGSHVGHKSGKTLATVLGTTLGGATGASVGNSMAEQTSKKQGVEVTVKLNDGSNRIVSAIQLAVAGEVFGPNQIVQVTQAAGGWHVSPL